MTMFNEAETWRMVIGLFLADVCLWAAVIISVYRNINKGAKQ